MLLCRWLSLGLLLSSYNMSSCSVGGSFGLASFRKADSRLVASFELTLKRPLRRCFDRLLTEPAELPPRTFAADFGLRLTRTSTAMPLPEDWKRSTGKGLAFLRRLSSISFFYM